MVLTSAVFLIVLVLTSNALGSSYAQLSFAVHPQKSKVLIGRQAIFKCGVPKTASSVNVFWQSYPSGRIITTETNANDSDRYEIMFGEELWYSLYDLRIAAVEAGDDTAYECVAVQGGTESRSARGELDVVVPLDTVYPQCFLSPRNVVPENNFVTAVCVSGNESAALSWSVDETPVISIIVTTNALDGGRFKYTAAEYNFGAEYNQRNVEIKCYSSLSNETCTVDLSVLYRPRVEIIPRDPEYPQEDQAKFTCKADANPEEMVYKWSFGGIEVVQDYFHHRFNHFKFEEGGRVLVIPKLMLEDNGVSVKCEATNALGSATFQTNVYVRRSTLTMETIGPILVGCICLVLILILLAWMSWYFCSGAARNKRRRPPPDVTTNLPNLRSVGYGPEDYHYTQTNRNNSRENFANMSETDNISMTQMTENNRIAAARNNPYATPPSRIRDGSKKSFKNLDLDDDDVGDQSGSYDVNPDPDFDGTLTSSYALTPEKDASLFK